MGFLDQLETIGSGPGDGTVANFGWADSNYDTFYWGKEAITASGVRPIKWHPDMDDELSNGLRQEGSRAYWKDKGGTLRNYRHPCLTYATLASLTSPLMGPMGIPPIIFNIYGEDLEVNETILRYALAAWGKPESFYINGSSDIRATQIMRDRYNGLPIAVTGYDYCSSTKLRRVLRVLMDSTHKVISNASNRRIEVIRPRTGVIFIATAEPLIDRSLRIVNAAAPELDLQGAKMYLRVKDQMAISFGVQAKDWMQLLLQRKQDSMTAARSRIAYLSRRNTIFEHYYWDAYLLGLAAGSKNIDPKNKVTFFSSKAFASRYHNQLLRSIPNEST
jgi:hypothetical protein